MKRVRKSNQRPASAIEKQQIVERTKNLYQNMCPEFIAAGIELFEKLGLPKELATKVGSMESFLSAVIKDSDITLEDVEKAEPLVQQMKLDPALIFKPALKKALSEMPRLRGGGRPRLVKTEAEKQSLRAEVDELVRKHHLSVQDAEKRTCLKHGLRLRTLQRIRAERNPGSRRT